jgi:cytidylate kinase
VTLVTIAASYGAGGSRVAPALAEVLDVPFLNRPPEQTRLSGIAALAVSWGTPAGMDTDELLPEDARRREFEREVRAMSSGVILGRGAAALLRDRPGALHVLLDGPRAARIEQAMAIEGIDRATAEQRLGQTDRFRRAYLEGLYGVDVREPGAFHLVLDSTALTLEDCVALLAEAARRRQSGLTRGSH